MSHTHQRKVYVNENHQGALDKPVWGAAEIGRVINRNPRQTHHLLTSGHIKSARRVGGRWVANVAALRREFGG
jgi:hypothetical protein